MGNIVDRVTRNKNGDLIPRENMQKWEAFQDIGDSRPSSDILAQNLYVACIEEAFEYLHAHYDGKQAKIAKYHVQRLEDDASEIQQEYALSLEMIQRADVMDIYTRFENYLADREVEYLQAAQLTRTRPLLGPSQFQDFYDDTISAMQILFDCPARRLLYAKFWATEDFLDIYPRVAKLYRRFDSTVKRENKKKIVATRKRAWKALQEQTLIENLKYVSIASPKGIPDKVVERQRHLYLDFRHWGIIATITTVLLLAAWVALPLPTASPVVIMGLLFLGYSYRKIANLQSRVDAYLEQLK